MWSWAYIKEHRGYKNKYREAYIQKLESKKVSADLQKQLDVSVVCGLIALRNSVLFLLIVYICLSVSLIYTSLCLYLCLSVCQLFNSCLNIRKTLNATQFKFHTHVHIDEPFQMRM